MYNSSIYYILVQKLLIVISLIGYIKRYFELIVILEKDKITPEIRNKLLKKGLSLIGMSDKEIIFRKLKGMP